MILWDVPSTKTTLFFSYFDVQKTTVTYTAVTGEATAAATSGTLAFKGGGAKRTCFSIAITITASGEIFTDNRNGILSGTLGGTGTINYMTGAWTLSSSSAGTAAYAWEDSSVKGVCDFTSSATRLATEGFFLAQGDGGDSIQKVTYHDGSFFSLKSRSAYKVTLEVTDLLPKNEIFRKDLGMQYWRSSVTTGKGIIFMDTANKEKPQLTILTPNAI